MSNLKPEAAAVPAHSLEQRLRGHKSFMTDFPLLWEAADALASQREALHHLRELSKALADKLDLIAADPQFQSHAVMAAIHGMQYTGPNWVEELAAIRAALAASPDGDRLQPIAAKHDDSSQPIARCEGRYPVPQTSPPREEPFEVTYRCGREAGHSGPHGAASPDGER